MRGRFGVEAMRRPEQLVSLGFASSYPGRVSRRFVNQLFSGCLQGYGMVVLFFIPILILVLVAVVPTWPYNKNWSYYPAGGMGAILVLTIVLLFLNRI